MATEMTPHWKSDLKDLRYCLPKLERRPGTEFWENLYQAFKARMESEREQD